MLSLNFNIDGKVANSFFEFLRWYTQQEHKELIAIHQKLDKLQKSIDDLSLSSHDIDKIYAAIQQGKVKLETVLAGAEHTGNVT